MSFQFDKILSTKNITKGTNSKTYIVLHHTGGGSFDSNCNTLTNGSVSCHFVIGQWWESAKIWDPDNILRHAGKSRWWDIRSMNEHSLGIEFVDVGGTFSKKQFNKGVSLIVHLMKTFNIHSDCVVTHQMITNWITLDNVRADNYIWSAQKKRRTSGEVTRKSDINPSFRQSNGFDNYAQFLDWLEWLAFWY